MNEDQARLTRLYQYLLAKDVYLKEQIMQNQKQAGRINPHPDDVFNLWYSIVRVEMWEEIVAELWKLLK